MQEIARNQYQKNLETGRNWQPLQDQADSLEVSRTMNGSGAVGASDLILGSYFITIGGQNVVWLTGFDLTSASAV